MFPIRQSLPRLVQIVGTNPFHFGASNPCFYVRGNNVLQWRQQCLYYPPPSVATICKPPWTGLSLSHRYLTSESPSSQKGLGSKDPKEIKIKEDVWNLDKVDEDWEEEGVICPHCGTGFTNDDALQNHIDKTGLNWSGCKELWRKKNKEDVLAGIKPHVCDECGLGFKIRGNLNSHKLTHSTSKSFACTHCDKMYRTLKDLNNHKKLVHSNSSFPCPECNKSFKTKTHMMKHWKVVCSPTDNMDKEFKCGQCGKKFITNSELTQHIKTVHSQERPFACEECGSAFYTKGNLLVHIRTVHENARPHKCEDCDATFQTSTALNNHRIAKHTFEWNVYCDVCDQRGIKKGFVQASLLKKHMISRHPAEYQEKLEAAKPAVCPKCNKRFPSEDQVEIHLRKMHSEI